MRNANDLDSWVAKTTGEDSWRTVAEKLHTTHSTIKRRLSNHEADAIVELARAYGANPIDGLLHAGIITEIDVKAAARTYTVDDLSDVEVAQVIVDRLEAAERRSSSPTPATRPLDDNEIAEAIRRANQQPKAAHPATEVEYTEPEFP